ncbi:MAG TPA: radical SAM protein [Deltaproteobacteria bacterium]|nr:radical SAM protein [Deltaproteobacteria bacterium]HQB37731.1 radical SAM protein [Deltaproteobacteria bacterium]
MNVLLINPPSLSIYSTFGLGLPPMGLLYVAAALENQGHRVVIRDINTPGGMLSDSDILRAELVGISSDTTRIPQAMKIARRVSRLGRPVIMGGPHPQFMAAEILSSADVNCIVKGEGELVMTALAAAYESGSDLTAVKGLIFQKNGLLTDTGDAEPPDVERLPLPARHLVDMRQYSGTIAGRPVAGLISSRGCPGACHFCSSSSFFGRRWRPRSPQSILEEIDLLHKQYGYKAIAFLDDNYTLLPERVNEISDGLIARDYDLKLWNFSRVDTIVRNPEMVARMARAGTCMVYLGIESDNEETLNSLGKRSSPREAAQAVELLRTNGIESYGSYIIGTLNDTPASIKRTVGMAIRLNTNIAQFSILTPYPGTQLFSQLKDRIFTRKWKFFDGLHLVFRHPVFNRYRLQFLLLKAFFRYYRRSREAIDGFKQAGTRSKLTCRKLATCFWELFI